MKKFLHPFFFFLAILLILILSNPGEGAFIKRISQDYGSLHHGLTITPEQLKAIGEGVRTNYIFWSKYDYQFGNIGVRYYGIFGLIYFHSSKSNQTDKLV